MRRLIWGLLATTGLLLSACGTDGDESSTPLDEPPSEVIETALASSGMTAAYAAARDGGPNTAPPPPGAFHVLVTSPEGVSSPGLDAMVSVLVARPGAHVSVMAPAADVSDAPAHRSNADVAPVSSTTMTGHPATAVNGSMVDTLDLVLDPATPVPDLAVVGAATRSAGTDLAATTLAERGIPVLVVAVDEDPDLAAAGLALSTVLDYHLEAVFEWTGHHVLTVPSCAVGTVRGPVRVDPTDTGPLPPADCSNATTEPFDDEAGAVANGFAALAGHA